MKPNLFGARPIRLQIMWQNRRRDRRRERPQVHGHPEVPRNAAVEEEVPKKAVRKMTEKFPLNMATKTKAMMPCTAVVEEEVPKIPSAWR